MAVLSEQDRFDTWAEWMRQNAEAVTISKTDLRAAFDAIDDWFDTNAATLNNALPAAAKAGLSQPQKAALLSAVIAKRYLKGS